ncbi:MAG: 3-phosphoshikimate 1-carboxyvinyltransferase, partial [Tissierellia bacterium]|nr:3-phosphoshikimate 1-carboxyvinyltransferase [Tissierellia bacterium]
MLKYFGGQVFNEDGEIHMESNSHLVGKDIYIPGDISSAAYFMVASSLI